MMKIKIVEMQPPPNFHAAAPASIPLNGPSIYPPGKSTSKPQAACFKNLNNARSAGCNLIPR